MVSALIVSVGNRRTVHVQALKVLVIVMGIMIVAAVVVIVVTIINRSQDLAQRSRPYEATIAVPQGEILETTAGSERTILRFRLPDGRQRLVVIDTERGRLHGTIDLEPQ